MKSEERALAENAPWKPAQWELADAWALKALARGEADADQQMRALKWIIERAAGAYELSYRPGADGDRESAMAEGRRFVGLQVVKLLNLVIKKPGGEPAEQG